MNTHRQIAKFAFAIAQIIVWASGFCDNAIAESSTDSKAAEAPMFSLEKRTMLSMTGLGQEYRIDIHPDLTVVFHGLTNTRIIGEARGKLTQKQLIRIFSAFSDIRFLKLDPVYGWERRDGTQRIVESEDIYEVTFRVQETKHTVKVSSVVPQGTPPGFFLLIDEIKRLSGARQWACPASATSGRGGRAVDVCEFPE